jgi:ribosomal protein S18 acetylase RimI-like enzyme
MTLVKVAEFTSAHIQGAADVLVGVHGHGSETGPHSTLADRHAAMRVVTALRTDGPAVVALDGSSVVGYMVGPLPKSPGPSTSRLRPGHHAARPEFARDAYRLMYEAVATRLVASGCTDHSIPIIASMREARDALFELEFGVDQIKGVISLKNSAPASTAGQIRIATAADLDQLIELAIELQKFHSRSPMFRAALLDVSAIRSGLANSVESDAHAVLVARDGDRLSAMMQAEPDNTYTDAVVIGMNVVTEAARGEGLGTTMLRDMLDWAATRDYRYCTVGWTSSNLMSDAFYRSRGFAPLRYRLHRRIDSRVAWANEALDYSVFDSHEAPAQ